jgi:hypothetical protein
MTKKSKILTLMAGLLILVVVVLSAFLNFDTAKTRSVEIQFIGFSKSVPTAFSSALPAHYAGFVGEWLSSGTNVARFSVTNKQFRNVLLYPYASLYDDTNAARSLYQTFLLNSPDAYGVFLGPGEAAIIEVPVLPHSVPGMIRLGWTPDYRHAFGRLTEDLRTIISRRKRATFDTKWVYTQQITP